MQYQTVQVENPNCFSVIIGKSPFIETARQIHKRLVATLPGIKFGLTYIDPSRPTVVKFSGTDDELIHLAKINSCKIGAREIFVLFLENDFPVTAMEAIKEVDNISEIYCATPNSVDVIVTENERGRSLMGIADDYSSAEKKTRKDPVGARVFNLENS